MKRYYYDPRLFSDCDPHRIPFGEPGYDPYLDRPLPRMRGSDFLDSVKLALRESVLDGRLKRFQYEQRLDALRNDARAAKELLSRRA